MAGSIGQIRVKGQRELDRAFFRLRRDVLVGLKPAILEVADVVRQEAEAKAVTEISHIGPRWSRMRIGVTPKSAYVAPKQRRRSGSPRPNLGVKLQQVMQDAADKHEDALLVRLDELVDVAARDAGFF